MQGIILKSLIILLSFSGTSLGADIKAAHKLFAMRSHYPNLLKAKKIYREVILKSKEPSEKLEAFDRFARLSLLQGELGPYVYGKSVKKSASVFDECISLSKELSPESLGFLAPEYAYWRSTCMGLWGNNSSVLAITLRLPLLKEMSNLIEYGQTYYPDFEGGAFFMMAAGLKIRSRLLKVLDLYNPEQALHLLENMEKRGIDDFTALLMKAEAQNALSRKDDARMTLQNAINLIEKRQVENTHNPLFVVENLGVLYLMKESMKNLNFTSYAPIKL